jgi:hypothetical protein
VDRQVTRFASIFALFYGSFHQLHVRLLESLSQYGPIADYSFWCNQVCDATRKWMDSHFRHDYKATWSDENVPKYVAMRTMFEAADPSEWLVWFDDDSYVIKPDWWSKTCDYLKIHRQEDICYVGQRWYVHHLPGQEDFIRQARWYKSVPWEQCPTRSPKILRPGISFAQGSYWWLRSDVRNQLNWPDSRLVHNGGDTLLGEAVRQQKLPLHDFSYGVKLNAAKRRGRNDRPAGSSVDTRR